MADNLTAAEHKQRPLLIGITGKARAGKDTLAWMLLDTLRHRGIDARRYGWADALKAVCRVEHGMRGKDAELLQGVGVRYRQGCRATCFESFGIVCHTNKKTPDVWVNTLLATIDEDQPEVALISDTRFPNEVETIRSRGGLLIRIERPDRPASGRDDTHISEVALDDTRADFTIMNREGLHDLRLEARWLAKELEDRL